MMTKLRQTRIRFGLSMIALSKRAGVSYSSLSRYENGWQVPTTPTAEKPAKALGATVRDLGLEREPHAPDEGPSFQ